MFITHVYVCSNYALCLSRQLQHTACLVRLSAFLSIQNCTAIACFHRTIYLSIWFAMMNIYLCSVSVYCIMYILCEFCNYQSVLSRKRRRHSSSSSESARTLCARCKREIHRQPTPYVRGETTLKLYLNIF